MINEESTEKSNSSGMNEPSPDIHYNHRIQGLMLKIASCNQLSATIDSSKRESMRRLKSVDSAAIFPRANRPNTTSANTDALDGSSDREDIEKRCFRERNRQELLSKEHSLTEERLAQLRSESERRLPSQTNLQSISKTLNRELERSERDEVIIPRSDVEPKDGTKNAVLLENEKNHIEQVTPQEMESLNRRKPRKLWQSLRQNATAEETHTTRVKSKSTEKMPNADNVNVSWDEKPQIQRTTIDVANSNQVSSTIDFSAERHLGISEPGIDWIHSRNPEYDSLSDKSFLDEDTVAVVQNEPTTAQKTQQELAMRIDALNRELNHMRAEASLYHISSETQVEQIQSLKLANDQSSTEIATQAASLERKDAELISQLRMQQESEQNRQVVEKEAYQALENQVCELRKESEKNKMELSVLQNETQVKDEAQVIARLELERNGEEIAAQAALLKQQTAEMAFYVTFHKKVENELEAMEKKVNEELENQICELRNEKEKNEVELSVLQNEIQAKNQALATARLELERNGEEIAAQATLLRQKNAELASENHRQSENAHVESEAIEEKTRNRPEESASELEYESENTENATGLRIEEKIDSVSTDDESAQCECNLFGMENPGWNKFLC